MDIDLGLGVADTLGGGRDGEAMAAEGDGVIAGDRAVVLEGEGLIGWPRAVGGALLGRRQSEVGVEGRQVGSQNAISLFQGGGLGFPELFDQSILKGAKQAFDAALGGSGTSSDGFDG